MLEFFYEWMPRFKKRVLAFIEEDHSKVETSKVFNGSKRCSFLWIKEHKERGDLKLKVRDLRPYTIDGENWCRKSRMGHWGRSWKKSCPLFKRECSLFSWGCLRTFLCQFFILSDVLKIMAWIRRPTSPEWQPFFKSIWIAWKAPRPLPCFVEPWRSSFFNLSVPLVLIYI